MKVSLKLLLPYRYPSINRFNQLQQLYQIIHFSSKVHRGISTNIVKIPPLPYTLPMERGRITIKRVIREIALLPTHPYRVIISPWLPPTCIYTPSCSSYMVESVRRHGIFKGTALGFARIARCHHTFFYGGPDPVPDEFSCDSIKTPYKIFRRRKHRHKKD